MNAHNSDSQVRIQKVIANAGIASRRAAEKLIAAGLVKVNGKRAELGQKMNVDSDFLEVEGEHVRLSRKQTSVVYAFYKPKRCVTTLNDPQQRSTVKDYFPETKKALFPVGRLDYDAEGLLLLTNDGDFAQHVIHPKYDLWKTYFVKVKGKIDATEIEKLKKGPVFDGKQHRPTKIKPLHTVNDKSWLEVSLQEGKNHHIKKMFKILGYPVLKIKRYSIGSITLGDLEPGTYRKLTPEEISSLVKLADR